MTKKHEWIKANHSQHVQEIGSYLLDKESTQRINLLTANIKHLPLEQKTDVPLNDVFPEGVAIFHKSLARCDPQMRHPKA